MKFPTDRVYKFSSFNEYSISALADNSVWFSNVKKMNDPFEGFVTYNEPLNEDQKVSRAIKFEAERLNMSVSSEKALELAMQRYLEDKDLFIERVTHSIKTIINNRESFLDSCCVFSTSVDSPSYPYPHYANMLMWSHYGNGFSGFCLKFSAEKLYDSLKQEQSKLAWSPVDYVATPVEINILDCLCQDSIEYCRPIWTKHNQWHYEEELRFISQREGLHRYSPEALDAIYIGEKMPKGQQSVLLAIAKTYFPQSKVFKVRIHPSGYHVIADEI